MAALPIGELAGLATAGSWAISALAWGSAGRRVGAVAVACLRSVMALLILAAGHWAIFGSPWPMELPSHSVWLLLISGALGAGIGDVIFFRGLVLIGPRLAMLILALSPILTSLVSYLTLGESLGPPAIIGIAMTIAGVAWVVAEPKGRLGWRGEEGKFRIGVILALSATAAYAGGYVLSKAGMELRGGVEAHALSATLIRMTAASVLTSLVAGAINGVRATARVFADRRVTLILLGGTLAGPVFGIWLSMVALKLTPAGVATALIGTAPIMMIPLSYIAYREKPTARSLIGTALAVAGIFVLMMR